MKEIPYERQETILSGLLFLLRILLCRAIQARAWLKFIGGPLLPNDVMSLAVRDKITSSGENFWNQPLGLIQPNPRNKAKR